SCGRRFDWQSGELPRGYDHKYVFSHVGYNLNITELQAAVGLSQLEKLEGFIARRRENFAKLSAALRAEGLDEHFILPRATARAAPPRPATARPGRHSNTPATRDLPPWMKPSP